MAPIAAILAKQHEGMSSLPAGLRRQPGRHMIRASAAKFGALSRFMGSPGFPRFVVCG
jgi:hypothetical protein